MVSEGWAQAASAPAAPMTKKTSFDFMFGRMQFVFFINDSPVR
jgi:hypothetical protein